MVPRLASGALQPATAAVDWRTGAMILSRSGRAAADQLTLTVEEATRSRALTPAFHSAAQAQAGERPVEVTYVRDLPGAVRLQAAGYEIAFSPHASMHVSNAGHAAEAGGVVSIGRTPDSAARRGFVRDEDPLANASRWYLFVGASGRLVGWSMLRNDDGGWRPVNLSGSGPDRRGHQRPGRPRLAQRPAADLPGLCPQEGEVQRALPVLSEGRLHRGPVAGHPAKGLGGRGKSALAAAPASARLAAQCGGAMTATAGAASTGARMGTFHRLRSIVGGSAGNLVEWYDWYAYSAFTLYFAKVFFPAATRPRSC